MPETNARVRAVIDRFVNELTTIAREEAARIVLGGIAPPGRAREALSSGSSARAAGRGAKRSPEKLAALQTKVLNHIKSHPGLRVEQLNEALDTKTKDLALPIRKLIVAKQIRAQGTRRATKYFAGAASKHRSWKKSKR